MSTDTKPGALRLADQYASDGWIAGTRQWCEEAAAELRRLHQVETAFLQWIEKTDWVQETIAVGELGLHRADALKSRIERLQAENHDLRAQLEAIGAGGVEPLRKRGCLHHIEEPLKMVAR